MSFLAVIWCTANMSGVHQMIDEIKVVADDLPASSSAASGMSITPPLLRTWNAPDQITNCSARTDPPILTPSIWTEKPEKFKLHLSNRSTEIKKVFTAVCAKIPTASPDVGKLQQQLAERLAVEKEHIVELQRVTAEKDQLNKQLEDASYRYMVAEKKLDRAKSAAVAKLEAANAQTSAPPVKKEDDAPAPTNGVTEKPASNDEVELARKEAVAASEKRAEQLEQLAAENKKLMEDVTTLNIRLASLSDDDYAKTPLFKTLKTQHEEVINRINDLEATNVQLREEAQKLQAERTQYKVQMDEEARKEIMEVEGQLARAETDLTRVRNLRDEYQVELNIKKAALDRASAGRTETSELASARADRIAQLESEVERLRLRIGEISAPNGDALAVMSADDLRAKLASTEKAYALLSGELPSMEAAWKKAQALASKKVAEIGSWEEQLTRLTTEKAKADQKYFAAMKAKEARDGENRALRAQNQKSSEIVSQLKESEAASRALALNLERQLAESKIALDVQAKLQAELQHKVSTTAIAVDGAKAECLEIKKALLLKDKSAATAASEKRKAEVELEEMRTRFNETKKGVDGWKKKAQDNTSTEEKALRVSTFYSF